MGYINGNKVLTVVRTEHILTVDDELSKVSENPVQNKVVTKALNQLTKNQNIYAYNLFDTLGIVNGKYINWNNGNEDSNADFYSSPFIEITAETSYSMFKTYCYAFYDSSKTFISGSAISYNLTDVTSPSNAKYIRISSSYDKAISNILLCETTHINNKVFIKNLDTSEFILNELGTNTDKAPSQKVVNDSIDTIKNHLSIQLVNTNIVNTANITYDKYINWNNGNLTGGENYCTSDYFSVDPSINYCLFNLFVYAFYDSSKAFISAGTVNYGEKTITSPANAKYMRVSTLKTIGFSTVLVCKQEYFDSKIKLHNLDLSILENKLFGKGFMQVTGDLSSGNSLNIGHPTSIKKNTNIIFSAKVTNLTEFILSIGTSQSNASYITLNATQVHITNKKVDGTYDIQTFTHGLTIAEFLYVIVKGSKATANIIIVSSDGSYEINNTLWNGDGDANLIAQATNCNLTNCKLIYSSSDLFSKVHAYGDSYFQYTLNSMWTYYLLERGYDKALLNGFPGENSATAYQQFLTNIAMNVPQYAIWCMGMNDGDTDDNTVSTRWKTNYDNFIATCKEKNITPILATIPTTPTVNNNAKNTIVKASGYRYIDFEKAVGSNTSGVWYAGMLSSDNVHPTILGAKALFSQAIIDAPELTFN